MPRIRSVHPEFFTDEDVIEVSPEARLLLIGIGTQADDKGIFPWKPKALKVRILPVDNVDVEVLLDELLAAGMVQKFEVQNRPFGSIKGFRLHQRPRSPNDLYPITDEIRTFVGLEKESEEKQQDKKKAEQKAEENEPSGQGSLSQNAENEPVQNGPLSQDAEIPPQMEDGGWRSKGSSNDEPCPFSDFWTIWPNKVAKQKAETAFKRLSAANRRLAIERAEQWFAQWRAKHPDATAILPATYLNGRRWEDQQSNVVSMASEPRYGERRQHKGTPQVFINGEWVEDYA